ncbi:ACT domain-containing protein [Piscirickettsia litoralis]|uniref:ACT domain-containing protein n=1 Tax=Piscirickettsia litoralis TaxID=1891921 RepID=UPI000AE344AE|nr:ACT domain-containing protein [Piscirickettsia litoralis]
MKGQLDFSIVGVLKQVITPLADAAISVYTISTFDTDYILVKKDSFLSAVSVLSQYFTIEHNSDHAREAV